jgi:hypothetical protein
MGVRVKFGSLISDRNSVSCALADQSTKPVHQIVRFPIPVALQNGFPPFLASTTMTNPPVLPQSEPPASPAPRKVLH